MGNGLAYLMLAIWPVVCLVLFRTQKVERALIWSILGGYLFLPPLTEFNLPLVPGMDKITIPNLSVLLIMLFAMKERVQLWPQSRVAQVLVMGLILSPILTVLTNGDPINFEVLRNAEPIIFLVDQLPGQSVRDIGSVVISQILTIVPFLLARQLLSTEDGLREILLAFMVGALIYSVPSLIEIRLSPQMNVWIYGFFQHSFEQMMRAGGFRPIVFLPHGLWLALFVCIGLMSAAALTRVTPALGRWKMVLLTLYLAVLLVLCKSLASLAYGLALTPLILFIPARWQIRVAVAFAFVAVTYPMLRGLQLVPLDAILAQAEAISAARAESLGYRFNNEEQLLARAAEKPLFGWSGWGRSLVRDPETAQILTVPDGRWIIIFGTFGWAGYICEFGLLALPLILMWRSLSREAQVPVNPYAAPLCLILGITLMDMLLNATLTPLTWLTAGAILGHAERRMPRTAATPRFALSQGKMASGPVPKGKRTVL
ncbi:putative membrane protein [Sulfitobacter noctilucae]|uniref:membrane protein n=1 Tax=Sulfitobacter noctilucae TaxID=1342302 RepID=UPI000469A75A|nr:membrane protein [Sulfitobacter noctilucae]KIN61604.1 putative membrane protein [Sulfitobacter noctilucae]